MNFDVKQSRNDDCTFLLLRANIEQKKNVNIEPMRRHKKIERDRSK